MAVRVLVVDNYDSFTYNLVQYLGELGAEVEAVRNDAATVEAKMLSHLRTARAKVIDRLAVFRRSFGHTPGVSARLDTPELDLASS